MGYSYSRHTVTRNRPQLEQMLQALAQKASIHFPTSDPHDLAYKLREARKAALRYEEFSQFHPLFVAFIIRETKTGVLAQYQDFPRGIICDVVGEILLPQAQQERVSIPDAVEYLDIIGAALKNDSAMELTFSNASLGLKEKPKLLKWASENGWKYIDHNTGGLTLTKRDVPEEVLWKNSQ